MVAGSLETQFGARARSIRRYAQIGIFTGVSLLLEKESLHKKKCPCWIWWEEHCELVVQAIGEGGGKLGWITFHCENFHREKEPEIWRWKKNPLLTKVTWIERAYNFTHRKPTNYFLYACGQCYSMSKLVILHSLKMVISIFGPKRGHLIYLPPHMLQDSTTVGTFIFYFILKR